MWYYKSYYKSLFAFFGQVHTYLGVAVLVSGFYLQLTVPAYHCNDADPDPHGSILICEAGSGILALCQVSVSLGCSWLFLVNLHPCVSSVPGIGCYLLLPKLHPLVSSVYLAFAVAT